jgi:hypothetical protein
MPADWEPAGLEAAEPAYEAAAADEAIGHDEATAPDEDPDNTASVEPATASDRDPRIAAAMQQLEQLTGRPPEQHVETYEEVHRALAEVLAEAASRSDASAGEAGCGPDERRHHA